MRLYKKLRFWLSVVAILGIAIYLIFGPSFQDEICQNFEQAKELKFQGVVQNKYIDKDEHSYPIIEIKQFNNENSRLNLTNDKSGLFDFLQIGDTVIKKTGTTFRVKKANRWHEMNIDFGCE